MEEINHRSNLENLYETNKNKFRDLQSLLESLDKIEYNIEKKLENHQKYIEILNKNFKQSIDSYHTICKNLTPTSLKSN